MAVSVRHLKEEAKLYVDGRRVNGVVSIENGVAKIEFSAAPSSGMHLLQMQNKNGLFSNDFIFYVREPDTAEKTGAE